MLYPQNGVTTDSVTSLHPMHIHEQRRHLVVPKCSNAPVTNITGLFSSHYCQATWHYFKTECRTLSPLTDTCPRKSRTSSTVPTYRLTLTYCLSRNPDTKSVVNNVSPRGGETICRRRWQFDPKITADLRPSADWSAVRTSLVAGGG